MNQQNGRQYNGYSIDNNSGGQYPLKNDPLNANLVNYGGLPYSPSEGVYLNTGVQDDNRSNQGNSQRNDNSFRRRQGKGDTQSYETNNQQRRQHYDTKVNHNQTNQNNKYNNNSSGNRKGNRKGKGKGKGGYNNYGASRGGGGRGESFSQTNDNKAANEYDEIVTEGDDMVDGDNQYHDNSKLSSSSKNHSNQPRETNGGYNGQGGGGRSNGNRYGVASTEELVRRLKASRWRPERQRALAELGSNPEHRKKLSAPAATVVVAAAGRDNGWRDALKWLELMKSDGSTLDVFHFSAGINACAKGRQWEEALQLLREMTEQGVLPDEVCFNGAINACARAGRSEQALKLLEEMKEKGLTPNTVSYSAAISACAKGGEWERALTLLEEMRLAGHEPNVISYSAAMSACAKGGQWEKALSLLEEMRTLGLNVDVVCYNAAIGACGGAKDYKSALSLLQQMRQENVLPNVVTFNAAIGANEKAGQWQNVLMLLDDMKRHSVRPDIISYNLAISACEQGNQGRRALGLLQEMRRSSISPEASTFNATVKAMANTEDLKSTLELWNEMASLQLEPSLESTSCLLHLCDRHNAYQASMTIFSELTNRGCRIQLDATLYAIVMGTCNKAIAGGYGNAKLIEDFITKFPPSKLIQQQLGSVDVELENNHKEDDGEKTLFYVLSPVSASVVSNHPVQHHPDQNNALTTLSSSSTDKDGDLFSANTGPGWQLNDMRSHIQASPIRSRGVGKHAEDDTETLPNEFLGPHDWWASSFATSLSSTNEPLPPSSSSIAPSQQDSSIRPLFDSWSSTSSTNNMSSLGGFSNTTAWPMNQSVVDTKCAPPSPVSQSTLHVPGTSSAMPPNIVADDRDDEIPPLVLDQIFDHLGIDDDVVKF